jgi:hypothetical protein
MKQRLLVGLLVVLSWPAWAADECTININHDVEVSSEYVRVGSQDAKVYEFVQSGYLSVSGTDVELTNDQRVLTEHYAGEVAAFVPQLIELVSEALSVAGKSLEIALTGAFGENELTSKPARVMEEARSSFLATARPQEGVYRLVSEDYESFDESLESELEATVTEVMGVVMSQLGSAMMASGESSFTEKMEAFGERMELVGQEIETSAAVLEETGDELCESMRAIAALESEMISAVPALAGYSLFE